MSWLRRGVTSPKFPVEDNNVIARDGKALPVEFTLLMAREVIDDPHAVGREKGLALALEAALMRIKEGT